MVGNAEPGKEYNYRPLSKLCECQLDVNDQVSTKVPKEGGLRVQERAEFQRTARDRQTERAVSVASASAQSRGPDSPRVSLECAEVQRLHACPVLLPHLLRVRPHRCRKPRSTKPYARVYEV